MTEIYTNGPVDATFNVYSDFMSYSGGVYSHKHGSYDGLHSVTIVGWGVDESTNQPYWLVRNSWGNWGPYSGYFKFIRGNNDCMFEEWVYAGLPRV